MLAQQEYDALAQQADDQTTYLSFVTQMLQKPACQSVIQLGTEVLPFLFQDIKDGRFHCHWRMAAITTILEAALLPPVEISEQFRGKVREMERIYVEYGVTHQYI